jgi:hypothetical protein
MKGAGALAFSSVAEQALSERPQGARISCLVRETKSLVIPKISDFRRQRPRACRGLHHLLCGGGHSCSSAVVSERAGRGLLPLRWRILVWADTVPTVTSEPLNRAGDNIAIWHLSTRQKSASSRNRYVCAVTRATHSEHSSVASVATADSDPRPARAEAPEVTGRLVSRRVSPVRETPSPCGPLRYVAESFLERWYFQ